MNRLCTLFILLLCLIVLPVEAALTKAWWSVSPETPYVGQPYTLTLTLETKSLEEIEEIDIPGLPPNVSSTSTHERKGPLRHTYFSFPQSHPTARIVSIPESQIRAKVQALVYTNLNFYQFHSSVQSVTAPAFSYEVVPLPSEAKDAFLGEVKVDFAVNSTTFSSGDVLELAVRIKVTNGAFPENLSLDLLPPFEGRLYPFYTLTQSRTQLTAKAFYIAEGDAPITLTLAPLTVYDAKQKTRREVTAPSITLTPRPTVEEVPQTITLHLGKGTVHGLPLRFAPREGAIVIGALSEPYRRHETSGDWTRVSCDNGDGWILTHALGEEE